jgi:SAM-dependent methyltransferase
VTAAQRIAQLDYDPADRPQEAVARCNLCAGEHQIELARRDRYGYAVRSVMCARCGLVFLAPRLTAEQYAVFYDGVYRPLVSAYHGRTIDARTVQTEQADYAAELAAFLAHALPGPPRDVLDVGGSTGVVAGVLRDAFGAHATVLDPAPTELAVAAARGMETIAGLAEEHDFAQRPFDLVLLCQTVDHLLDVEATLRAIRRALAPGGRAFVDLLDLRFMARRRGSVEGAIKVDHPYYLTFATGRAFFARAGLEPVVERLSGDGHWGFLLAAAESGEPDWAALAADRDALLDELWALRARA